MFTTGLQFPKAHSRLTSSIGGDVTQLLLMRCVTAHVNLLGDVLGDIWWAFALPQCYSNQALSLG